MRKRSWIYGLVFLNVILLSVLVLISYSPPHAEAQEILQDSSFLLISVRAQQNTDVLYLVDRRAEKLYSFRIETLRQLGGPTTIQISDMRDLKTDFEVRGASESGNAGPRRR